MVMKKNVMGKNLAQTILKSITRYIAIVLIIALGAAIFVGLRTTKTDMVQTGQEFMDAQNMFDLRLLNSYGWTAENLDQIAAISGVKDVEGVITLDVLAQFQGQEDASVYKVYDLPDAVTVPYLLHGRMPQAPNECLVDGARFGESALGMKLVLSDKNEESTLDSLAYDTFTVVGTVSTPLYMDMSRGTTTLGNGTVAAYVYIPEDAFDVDYYSEICVTMDGDYRIYTEEFHTAMDDMAEYIKPLLEPIAQNRYESVMADAWKAYDEGLQELQEGEAEFLDAREETLKKLEEGRQELLDAQAEIDENRALLEDGLVQLEEGQKTIDEGRQTIIDSRQQLADARTDAYAQIAEGTATLMENRKTVNANLVLVAEGIVQIDSGLIQLNSGISQLESGLQQLDTMATLMESVIRLLDVSIQTTQSALDRAKENPLADERLIEALEARLQELLAERESYAQQYQEMEDNREIYSAQLEELIAKREEIQAQRAELVANQKLLQDALVAIEAGFQELADSKVLAEQEFAAAEAQIAAGEFELNTAQQELDARRLEAEEGMIALEDAQKQVDDGWITYQEGYEEAMQELEDAEAELRDGWAELADAKEEIDGLKSPDVFALGRNTNVSYLSLDSNSDIVEGVSAVFPVFFLLIAALVCITTMTRMVEEERTQIGTLKALGYSNGAIIGKYLAYAGSAAVLGCGLGVLVGSWIFPLILWQAYNIILNIRPDITLLIDWPLCLSVVAVYTAVTLGVTWYCCRNMLREVPAELIRPKPPTSGKKILLEYLPFWNRISFLNKVMLRNIFRYRQRLLMMLVGIGGCTALLLTGFGIKDSIMDIVDFQFQEVTLYDLEIRFADGLEAEEQEQFRDEIGRYVDQITFAHQSSVELDHNGQTRDIILIAADGDFENMMDFHSGKTSLSMPGTGEALLSIGMAEKLGIRTGDVVTLRNNDLETMTVTVTGIYDNHVYNYIIVTPDTMESQWGDAPEKQMAYLTVTDSQDPYLASTKVSAFEGVMSVTVCQDLALQVGSMLEAMNLVVVTIVICAGLLAVTVLYNLTNININERIREIATIKVLGFNAAESGAYVFKENLLLSVMGAAIGLIFGHWLLEFVMSQIKVDMVWMQARLLPISYFWSIALTLLSAVAVDFVLYFKLEKINMAEALKSVE